MSVAVERVFAVGALSEKRWWLLRWKFVVVVQDEFEWHGFPMHRLSVFARLW